MFSPRVIQGDNEINNLPAIMPNLLMPFILEGHVDEGPVDQNMPIVFPIKTLPAAIADITPAHPRAAFANKVIDKTTQATYVGGTVVGMLYTLSDYISDDANNAVSMGWDYIDGLGSIISGALLILDDTGPHQTQNKMFGATSIISGALQNLFAYQNFFQSAVLGGTALAAPVFAVGQLVDLTIASIELYYAAKKTEFNGWLEETLAEIAELDHKIQKAADNTSDLIKQRNARNALLQDVNIRCKIHLHKASGENKIACQRKINDAFNQVLPTLSLHTDTRAVMNGILNNYHRESISPDDFDADRRIQQKLDAKLAKSKRLLALKIISFIGMTLVALSSFTCPPALIFGLALTCVVAMHYLQKNTRQLKNRLFTHSEEKPAAEEKHQGEEAGSAEERELLLAPKTRL